jgi:hypothetical protein
MSAVRILQVLLAILMLTACAGISPQADEAQEVAGMLAGQERLAAVRMDEQRREFNSAQAEHDRAATDTTRLKLALMMLLPRAPWRDDARALSLLGAIEPAPGGQPSARHDLAQTLSRMLRAQRDEQRKGDSLSQQLREERRKLEEAQQKIDSLRAIDRESRMRRKSP